MDKAMRDEGEGGRMEDERRKSEGTLYSTPHGGSEGQFVSKPLITESQQACSLVAERDGGRIPLRLGRMVGRILGESNSISAQNAFVGRFYASTGDRLLRSQAS